MRKYAGSRYERGQHDGKRPRTGTMTQGQARRRDAPALFCTRLTATATYSLIPKDRAPAVTASRRLLPRSRGDCDRYDRDGVQHLMTEMDTTAGVWKVIIAIPLQVA